MARAAEQILEHIKQRQLVPVTVAYLAASWVLIQIAAIVFPALMLPAWTVRVVVILALVGFPVVMTLAWFFNVTPRGIERTTKIINAATGGRLYNKIEQLPPAEAAIASVTVLPFDSLNTEADEAGLSDGLATEIHSTLNRMHQVRVASRRSAFSYRNSALPLEEIARALDVRYVLSGSLLRSGNRIRVIADLDDAVTGTQIWSQKFEREIDDLLSVQAEIAEAIVGAFGIERERSEIARAQQRATSSLDAWELVQKSRNYINSYSESSLASAEQLLKRSIKLDKQYAAAHAALGSVLIEQVLNGYRSDKQEGRQSALEAVNTAQQHGPEDPFVLKMSGMVLAVCGQLKPSIEALRHCVKLAPYDFGAWGYFGWPLNARAEKRDLEELHEIIDRLLHFAPDHPGVPYWLYHKSVATSVEGNLLEAVAMMIEAAKHHRPVPWAYMHLANVYGQLGEHENAREANVKAQQLNAKMTPSHYAECVRAMIADSRTAHARLAGLAEAGLLPQD